MTDKETLAERMLRACDESTLTSLPTASDPAFDLAAAYEVADRMRRQRLARGAVPRGYKIGFTNRRIWPLYNVYAPIWSTVWAHTVHVLDGSEARASLRGLSQPRLEPEIVFGLRSGPRAGMSNAQLTACIEWVAHGFEIVHTHFSDWRFLAADTVVDDALHGRLYIGPRVAAGCFADFAADLRALKIELVRDGETVDRGEGSIVLDGPVDALRQWIDAMAAMTPGWPIVAGDVVTTGTLTDAWPLVPGERWHTRVSDQRLSALTLECAP